MGEVKRGDAGQRSEHEAMLPVALETSALEFGIQAEPRGALQDVRRATS